MIELSVYKIINGLTKNGDRDRRYVLFQSTYYSLLKHVDGRPLSAWNFKEGLDF
jgi:hypothetical protein